MSVAGPPDAVDLRDVRRVLVTKLRHHGDVLLAAPVVSALRRHAPHAEIDALVYRDTAPLLENHPGLTRLHAVDRAWKEWSPPRQAAAEWRLLSTLRRRRFDLLVHLTEHRRGAWLARALGVRFAVAPRRDRSRFWQRSFTHCYPAPRGNRPRHTVELNLDALRRIGVPIDEDDKALTLVPGAHAEARIARLRDQHGLRAGGYVVIHPGSRWSFKTAPPELIAEVASRLGARDVRTVITGAPDPRERAYVERVLALASPTPVDLSGTLSLLELAALIAGARAFVGVDSAPMHIAAAVGTPVVAAFGPSGELQWGPWRVAHRVVASGRHPCRPCGNDGCGGGKISECLTSLRPETFLAALDEVLVQAGRRPT